MFFGALVMFVTLFTLDMMEKSGTALNMLNGCFLYFLLYQTQTVWFVQGMYAEMCLRQLY